MKFFKATAYLGLLLLILYSCKKDNSITKTASSPLTATISRSIASNGTFDFSPTVKVIHDSISISGTYIDNSNANCPSYVNINLMFKAKQSGSYVINYGDNSAGDYCSLNSFLYSTDSSHSGSVTVTQLDTVGHIVSGIFKFAAEQEVPIRYGGVDTTTGSFTKLSW